MNRFVIVLSAVSAGGFFAAIPGYSMLPIPQDSGFSGFINLGVGIVSAERNMIAGNNLNDERTGRKANTFLALEPNRSWAFRAVTSNVAKRLTDRPTPWVV